MTDVPLPPLRHEADDPDEATALALVLATLEGDHTAVVALLDTADPIRLAAILSGMVVTLGTVALGSPEELAAYLREKLAP